jgi:hypothetical protein
VTATWSIRKNIFSRRTKITKDGVALFDVIATFPSVAIFLDFENALILQEKRKGIYVRVGTARFDGCNKEEVNKADALYGTVKEIVII